MKNIITFLVSTLLVFTMACTPKTTGNNPPEANKSEASTPVFSVLEVADFKTNLSEEGVKLIDVRRPEEFAEGHIEQAVNINFFDEDFKEKIQQHCQADDKVMLYCKSGGRSGRAAQILKEMGYQQILDLKGGYMAWSEAQE